MVLRNRNYLYVDGSFVCIDDLHCLYITPAKTAIVIRWNDGQQTEIKYQKKGECAEAWAEIMQGFKPDIDVGNIFISPHKTIIIRIFGLRYVEFDTIDFRFIMQYKDGTTYYYKYKSKTVTYEIFKRLLIALYGESFTDEPPIAETRHRADFWTQDGASVDGMALGEDAPNGEFWTIIDKSFVNAYIDTTSKTKK